VRGAVDTVRVTNSVCCRCRRCARQSASTQTKKVIHVYEVRPRKDKRGVDLISDLLPFGRLWYGEPNATSNAVDYAKFFSRAYNAVIRLYDAAGNVIETHEHKGNFKEL